MVDARRQDAPPRIGIVASRFNAFVVEPLVAGAQQALGQHGVDPADVPVVWVPGAFELPLAAQRLARSGRFDALVALGAVIRGDTPHFDYVCEACARGLLGVALREDLPVAFGVLTTDNVDQALARAGDGADNKGFDAALAALQTLAALRGAEG